MNKVEYTNRQGHDIIRLLLGETEMKELKSKQNVLYYLLITGGTQRRVILCL
jgi:hypothetical protein